VFDTILWSRKFKSISGFRFTFWGRARVHSKIILSYSGELKSILILRKVFFSPHFNVFWKRISCLWRIIAHLCS
jgi:hypothetical protein